MSHLRSAMKWRAKKLLQDTTVRCWCGYEGPPTNPCEWPECGGWLWTCPECHTSRVLSYSDVEEMMS